MDMDKDGVADGTERWIAIIMGVVLIIAGIYFMSVQNPMAPNALYPGIALLLGDKAIKSFKGGR